jgi:hypothetical protein
MVFSLPTTETDGFVRTDPYWGQGIICPGIRTKIAAAKMKKARWTSGPLRFISRWIPTLNYLYSMTPCTVTKSEVSEVEVQWLQEAPGIPDPDTIKQPPSILLRAQLGEVTVIGLPSCETVGFNSIRMLRVKPEDSLTSYDNWFDAYKKILFENDLYAEPKKVPAESHSLIRTLVSKKGYSWKLYEWLLDLPVLNFQASERVYEVPVKVLHRRSIVDVAWDVRTAIFSEV